MFDTIVLRSNELNHHADIDVGTFCEALLYYQNVHLIVQHGSFSSLVARIGIDNLRYILDNHHCHVTYVREIIGVATNTHPPTNKLYHDFGAFSKVPGNSQGQRKHRSREYVVDSLQGINPAIASGKIDRLAERIQVRSIDDLSYGRRSILDVARSDIVDQSSFIEAINLILEMLVPGYVRDPSNVARIHRTDKGFIFEHNLEFPRLNEIYHRKVPVSHSSLSEGHLLSWILSSRFDLAVATNFGTDIVTSSLSSALITQKISGIIDKASANSSRRNDFESTVLSGAPSLRELVNSGHLSIDEFLRMLDQASRFKAWLHRLPPDAPLVTEYFQEISKQDWYSRLPAKSLRFVFFAGAGVLVDILASTGVGIAAGLGIGIADNFVLEKLLKKWKPNQFVEDVLLQSLKK